MGGAVVKLPHDERDMYGPMLSVNRVILRRDLCLNMVIGVH